MADAIGKFQILGELGKGAHSTIYHIKRLDDGRPFALKVVPIEDKDDQKYLEQAKHEYRVGQMLDHPNLIKVHALETQRDWFFRVKKVHLLIEYVQGKTLDNMLHLSLSHKVQVFQKLAAGLVHMHRRSVFHADLKPNNIMISKAGAVKILDFGLAWIKGEPKGRVQGTPEYMAPEQAKDSVVNERTDIYNLGATMYRVITGKLPPSTLSGSGSLRTDAKLFQHMLKPVVELTPNTPEELCKLIHRCLAYEAKKRPERASEVQEVLDQLVEILVQSDNDRLEAMGM